MTTAPDTVYDEFANYSGVEDTAEVYRVIEDYRDKGYVIQYDTLDEVTSYLGGKPTLSKFGCIQREKMNPDTGEVKIKRCIIMDSKQSRVKHATRLRHKAVLPRATDVIYGAVEQADEMSKGEEITFLVADVSDAFWPIPLKHCEKKFYFGMLFGKYLVFTRTAQGSRGAPVTWAAIAGLGSRIIQWLFTQVPRGKAEKVRIPTYVDDPIPSIMSNKRGGRRVVACILLTWAILGFPIAFDKAKIGPIVQWIGVELQAGQDCDSTRAG